MQTFLQRADALLRGAADIPTWRRSFGYSIIFGLLYGAVMGSYGGWDAQRWVQIAYASLKVPLLLLVTFGFALPPFFVMNTLLGVRDDFAVALRAILEMQAGVALILASLAPLTLGVYVSTSQYEAAVLFNFLMFCLAACSAQIILYRRYRVLIARRAIHAKLMWAWLACYCFIAAQLAWTLRPFIGAPNAPVHFFRAGLSGNVYEVLGHLLAKLVSS
jgi:hypothetical protein